MGWETHVQVIDLLKTHTQNKDPSELRIKKTSQRKHRQKDLSRMSTKGTDGR